MAKPMDGQVAIVTGGANGIGRAIVARLAEQGCTVVVSDIDESLGRQVVEEVTQKGGQAIFLNANVAHSEQVNAVVRHALDRWGHVDILVNNAGICIPNSFEKIDDQEWDLVIDTNLKGAFNCCRAVLDSMKKRRRGVIVNIASMAARNSSPICGAHYTASKAGMLGLTRHLAKEVAPYGIRVNAVCPGATDTGIQRRLSPPEVLSQKAQTIPLRRIGTPEDQANAVLFLVSDSSGFITGATIDVNGGALMI